MSQTTNGKSCFRRGIRGFIAAILGERERPATLLDNNQGLPEDILPKDETSLFSSETDQNLNEKLGNTKARFASTARKSLIFKRSCESVKSDSIGVAGDSISSRITAYLLHLRRVTEGKTFLPEIDGLRFVAIASVVLLHVHGHLVFGGGCVRPIIRDGALLDMLAKMGVQLFFVISGFVLTIPFAKMHLLCGARVNIKRYYLKRVTRLEPLYFLNLLLWFFVWTTFLHARASDMLPHLFASLLYAHQLLYLSPSPLSGILWSLEVEVQFYMLAPLFALIFKLSNACMRRSVLIVLILASGAGSLHLVYTPAQLSLVYYVNFFLAGILLSDLYINRGRSWDVQSWRWDIVSLCGWPLVWTPFRSTAHVAFPLLIVLLYMAAFRGRQSKKLFSNPILTTVGGMCYSIYLFHWMVMSSTARFTQAIHLGNNFLAYFALQCAMIVPAILLVSVLFFIVIERPCMDSKWPSRLRELLPRHRIEFRRLATLGK